ncbi:MAG: hypothetical protein Q9215_000710 [Flavoplaca cf. flavocitrina]
MEKTRPTQEPARKQRPKTAARSAHDQEAEIEKEVTMSGIPPIHKNRTIEPKGKGRTEDGQETRAQQLVMKGRVDSQRAREEFGEEQERKSLAVQRGDWVAGVISFDKSWPHRRTWFQHRVWGTEGKTLPDMFALQANLMIQEKVFELQNSEMANVLKLRTAVSLVDDLLRTIESTKHTIRQGNVKGAFSETLANHVNDAFRRVVDVLATLKAVRIALLRSCFDTSMAAETVELSREWNTTIVNSFFATYLLECMPIEMDRAQWKDLDHAGIQVVTEKVRELRQSIKHWRTDLDYELPLMEAYLRSTWLKAASHAEAERFFRSNKG